MRILVVDDEEQILKSLTIGFHLQWPHSDVLVAADAASGLAAFQDGSPDVVLLDIGLPDRSGLEVLQEIRRVSEVPVIMLTARGDETDQVQGLELGADDYVVKPFGHLALVARIRAVLRRAEPAPRGLPDFVAGDLAIDFKNRRVTVGGDPVKLTPAEYKLLYTLVRNAGRLVPHRTLVSQVLGDADVPGTDYLKVFVSRLRAKLERQGAPGLIETERGLGYRFVPPPGPTREP